MTDDKLREAAERLRKMRKESAETDGGYPATAEGRRESCYDHVTLAEAWLAEHPSEDDVFDLSKVSWSVIGSTEEYSELKSDIAHVCRDVTCAGCIDEHCIADIVATFKKHGYLIRKEHMPAKTHGIQHLAEHPADKTTPVGTFGEITFPAEVEPLDVEGNPISDDPADDDDCELDRTELIRRFRIMEEFVSGLKTINIGSCYDSDGDKYVRDHLTKAITNIPFVIDAGWMVVPYPADDDESVTEEWCDSHLERTMVGCPAFNCDVEYLTFHLLDGEWWAMWKVSQRLRRVRFVGEVRRLIEALKGGE